MSPFDSTCIISGGTAVACQLMTSHKHPNSLNFFFKYLTYRHCNHSKLTNPLKNTCTLQRQSDNILTFIDSDKTAINSTL